MQKTTVSHASRFFTAIAAVLALFLLTGCEMTITNLTPTTVPQNPSHIYTISASFQPKMRSVIKESVQPRIVIDGQSFPMRPGSAANVWDFDYQLPVGRNSATYYFICEYAVQSGSGSAPRDAYSELSTLSVNARYVLRSEASRAPVGARVNVLGAGFTPQDMIYLNEQPTRTIYESSAALSFFVPAVEPGRSYQLRISGPAGSLPVGTFRVDATNIQVSPDSLVIRSGEQQALTFTIPSPAPAGGTLVEVTTDVPESVVMPEVIVPSGLTSVTVPVTGGKPGAGSLFIRSSAGDSSVSVTVTDR